MAILAIFAPPDLYGGGDGDHFVTQFVSNPFGITAVWLQCTTKYVSGDGERDFGIAEIFFLDDQGQFQTLTFADDNSDYGALLPLGFVENFLGVTVATHTFDAVIEGTLTIFQWG
jgi:hypothetical protein